MALKIFISHSCKDMEIAKIDQQDPAQLARWQRLQFARVVREKIVEGLGNTNPNGLGYKVLLDLNRLEPGDDWCAKLHGWLGTCDGAVLLLSEDSISSEWVRKEATILTWRKSLRRELLLVPVFLGDLQPKAFKNNALDCLHLTETQSARLTPLDIPGGGCKVESLSDQDRESHATCLAHKVLDKFKGLAAINVNTEMEKWVRSVAARLQDVKPIFLDLVRKELQIHDEDWSDDEGYLALHDLLGQTSMLAHQLLSTDFNRLHKAMNAIRQGMSKEDFKWLVFRVYCQWVDARAAQKLLPGARPLAPVDSESRFLVLNATYEETSHAYIARAHCCELPPSRVMVITKPRGEAWSRELSEHIEKKLSEHFRLPIKLQNIEKGRMVGREELLKRREKMIEDRLKEMSFYVVLDLDEEGELDGVALENIRRARKNIIYLLIIGNTSVNIQPANDNLEFVVPKLTTEIEDEGERIREALISMTD